MKITHTYTHTIFLLVTALINCFSICRILIIHSKILCLFRYSYQFMMMIKNHQHHKRQMTHQLQRPRRSLKDKDVEEQLSTIIMWCSLLSELVKGLLCTACSSSTLAVQALRVVCAFETHCTCCGEVLNKTYWSDRLGGVKSSVAPFVVVQFVVSAMMDMDVGHNGFIKLCRHMDKPAIHHSTFTTHMKEVTSAGRRPVCWTKQRRLSGAPTRSWIRPSTKRCHRRHCELRGALQ